VEVQALAALVPEVLSSSAGTSGSSGSIGADDGDQDTGTVGGDGGIHRQWLATAEQETTNPK